MTEAVGARGSRALSRVGGAASILAALLLTIGLVGLAVSPPGLGIRNWLVVLLQINAGLGGLPADPLRVLNPLDVAALILVGVAFLGLWPGPGRPHRLWMAIAVALPFLGIAVLLVTHQAGRSGVMGGGIVVAILMFSSRGSKPLACLGLASNVFLLVGDFATGGFRAPVVAGLVGVGYLLLGAWFVLIGLRLLRGQGFARDAQLVGQAHPQRPADSAPLAR